MNVFPIFALMALLTLAATLVPTGAVAFGTGIEGGRGKNGQPSRGMGKDDGTRHLDGPAMKSGPQAGLNPEMQRAFMATMAAIESMEARGFFETGLRPAYPEHLKCQTADSFFGVTIRGDGSVRSTRFYHGRHGGLDIPAKGIAIIAMADGEVIEKSEGENIGGIKVVVRHSPADTGLDRWIFTEYKHLREPSPLSLHARVRKGEPVGIAGNTGTTGGRAYGPEGHYHLHLTTWYNNTGEYVETPKMLIPVDGYWLDPLAMLRGGPLESAAVRALPESQKQVRFAYMTTDGSVHPEGARVVWPFVCR